MKGKPLDDVIHRFILELVCTDGGRLGSSSSTLNVIETNSFKHLTHLALKFLPGSDSDVKKYLADCLKKFESMFLPFWHCRRLAQYVVVIVRICEQTALQK